MGSHMKLGRGMEPRRGTIGRELLGRVTVQPTT